jgi:hypothetical protein
MVYSPVRPLLTARLALAVCCFVAAWATPPALAAEVVPPTVQFNRDIRPILADNCFACHGPDKARRRARLHFDTKAGAFGQLGGSRAIVPRDLARSAMFRRITAADDKKRMPPARSGRRLTARQVGLIRRWIEQGARWQKHWSLLPPERPAVPASRDPMGSATAAWPRNPIDALLLDRLEREGLAPSPEADRTTLIRRLTLDLTGLPPTPAEVDAFLADTSPNAYERVVDRLLHSPRYGERMAARWLDEARYADTNGYQSDGERIMWRWRDWVIAAFNQNMPFDRFTVEQIAGDLLPGATLEQKIATGFNRNHRGNAEGGIIPEEYAVEYVVDRVDTSATVWLGLTVGCARCHDHKFDPITQKEYYRLFAYFNNVPERGKAVKYGNSPPMIPAPTPQQQEQLRELNQRLRAAESRFSELAAGLAAAQVRWEQSLTGMPIDWSVTGGLLAHYPLDGTTAESGNLKKTGGPARFRGGAPAYVPGRIGQAASLDGSRFIDAGDVADFGFYDKFSLAAWVYSTGGRGGTLLSRMADAEQAEGYTLSLEGGKLHVHLVKRWLDDAIRVESERSLAADRWHHVVVTYDGSRVAGGIKVYVNGRPEKLKVNLDDLNQDFHSPEPLRIGAGGGRHFRGRIDDVRVYNTVLSDDEVEVLATTASITEIAAVPPGRRTSPQAHKIRACFLAEHAAQPVRLARQQVVALRQRKARLIESFPTTMVMEELPRPRDTFVLLRGVYDKRGEKVTAGVPASLPRLPRGAPNNRLGLARWLVDPSNPLTARVAVNRYWQMYFGTGLVKTAEDFGSQGEWPTHPELLDWLATEFILTGWDVKAVQKVIVTSATYRQCSKVTPARLQQDPENRLLARGPRFRLPAEMIRDQALAAGGLLVERVGGSSVKPYQPAGLWKELADTDYRQDHGANLYRRSLYTFWKRTVAPPSMVTFDAAGREACTVRRARTNTPLQALALMNEVTYVEAARLLAERIMTEGGPPTPAARLTLAFRLATGRPPRPAELDILLAGFDEHLARYRRDQQAARHLVSVGERRRNGMLDVSALAAYTAVAGLILNLDETVTKE